MSFSNQPAIYGNQGASYQDTTIDTTISVNNLLTGDVEMLFLVAIFKHNSEKKFSVTLDLIIKKWNG